MRKGKLDLIVLVGIIAIYLALTSYHLRELPGEWYGDITIEHREVTEILKGGWPWQFNLSAGPAYHYVVAAFAHFLGARYETYKLASLVTGLIVVILCFLLGQEFAGRRVGLLTALVGAISFWLVLFARLGSSPQIFSPVLCAGSVYFLLRFDRTGQWWNVFASMVIAGFGLFTYPATFVLPVVLLALIVWRLIFSHARSRWWIALIMSILILVPFLGWFVSTVKGNSAFSQSGYLGSKIAEQGTTITGLAEKFGSNMARALGMFQWTGDNAFRTNASGEPMLDQVSGVLMDLGLIWLIANQRLRSRWGYIIIPIVLLVMPSAEPGIPLVEVPSASRALGAAPFVFMLVALGLDGLWVAITRLLASPEEFISDLRAQFQRQFPGDKAPDLAVVPDYEDNHNRLQNVASRGSLIAWVILGVLMVGSAFLNMQKYFGRYAQGLPEQNQPWGWLIAQYIDSLPSDVEVELTTCCWGTAGQPEPGGIYYVLKKPQGREKIISNEYLTSCDEIHAGKEYVIILPPNENGVYARVFQSCFPEAVGEIHYDGLGHPAFYSLQINLPSTADVYRIDGK